MPTVQRYSRQQEPQEVKPPDVSADVFGKAWGEELQRLGESMGQAGQAVSKAFMAHAKKRSDAKVRDVFNQAKKESREWMAANVYEFTEKAALDSYAKSENYLSEGMKDWMGRLDHDYEQEAFKKDFMPVVHSHLNGAMKWQMDQTDEYDRKTHAALIDDNRDEVVHNRWNLDQIEVTVAESMQSIAQYNKDSDPTVIKEEQDKERSILYASAVTSMIPDDASRAAEMFYGKDGKKGYGADIKGPAYTELQRSLESAVARQRGRVHADDIQNKFPGDYKKQYAAARDLINRGESEAVSQNALERLKIRKNEDDDLAAKATNELRKQKYTEVQDAENLEEGLEIADNVTDGIVRNELRRLARNEFGAKKIPSNPRAYVQGLIWIDEGQIRDQAELETLFRSKVSNEEYAKLSERLRLGGAAGMLKSTDVKRQYDMLSGLKEDNKNYYPGFKYVWEYVLKNLPAGEDPTDMNVRALVSQALLSGRKVRDWYPDEKMSFGQAWSQGRLGEFTVDVPKDEQKRIVKKLKSEGKPADAQAVRDFYLHDVMGVPEAPSKLKGVAPAGDLHMNVPADELTNDQLDEILIDMGVPVEEQNREAVRKNRKAKEDKNAANRRTEFVP